MYILSITLYSLSLQYYNKVSFLFSLKELRKIQCKAALQILYAFCIFSTLEIEAIVGLIPIHLYLQSKHINNSCSCYFSLENMTFKQCLKIKSSIVNTNNCFNGVFSFFFFLNQQFITRGAMVVCAYRRNYVWRINTLTFLCSYLIQRTTKELNP